MIGKKNERAIRIRRLKYLANAKLQKVTDKAMLREKLKEETRDDSVTMDGQYQEIGISLALCCKSKRRSNSEMSSTANLPCRVGTRNDDGTFSLSIFIAAIKLHNGSACKALHFTFTGQR